MFYAFTAVENSDDNLCFGCIRVLDAILIILQQLQPKRSDNTTIILNNSFFYLPGDIWFVESMREKNLV